MKHHNRAIDVVVHEKYGLIGYNHEGRRCGEAHSIEREWERWRPPTDCVYNTITRADVFIGSEYYPIDRQPGTSCILNRQAYIAYLGKAAENIDVDIQTHDKISSIDELHSDHIIDASGCPSIVKRELHLEKGFKGVTLQHTIANCNQFNPNKVIIHYSKKFGYFWIFPRDPKAKEVNVGVGIIQDFGYDLKKMLEDFKYKHGISGSVSYVSGGLIPLGLQRPFRYRNILFVGDAGVGAFPFSGQGIYRALLSGFTAGQLIAQGKEKQYPYLVNKMFIKWDILGKSFILMNLVLRRINEYFVFYTLNKFINVDEVLHI